MTVKTKLITTFIVFDFILILIITLGTYIIISQRAAEIEDQYALRNVARLNELIESQVNSLSKTNKDYAYWDDTYQFLLDSNNRYRTDNINQVNFGDTLGLDFVYFLNKKFELVDSWQSQDNKADSSLESIMSSHDIRSMKSEGMLWNNGDLMLVSMKEVLPSKRDKPSNGYMIIGYHMNQKRIDDLGKQLKVPVQLTIAKNDIPKTILEKDRSTIQAKVQVKDVLDTSSGFFTLLIQRDIYASSQMAFRYIVFLMLILFATSFVFVLRFSETVFGSILHRIRYLNIKAESAVHDDYAAPLNYCSWENSRDELGELARSVERMRVAAYESTSTLKKTVEEKTKELSIRLNKEEKTAQAVVYLLDREKQHSKDLIEKEAALTELTTALKQKNEDLKEANQVKNEFVNIATHQIKNPLAALRGFVGMIRQGMYGAVSSKLKEPIDQISVCTEQIVSLVEDMLKISRSEEKNYPMNIQSVNMMEIINTVIHQMEPQVDQKKLKIKYLMPKGILLVKADADKVKDIVTNLISNAIKYSEKGTITITHDLQENEWITSVADQGCGISSDEQKQLFQRFYRTRNAIARDIPGTGLGLYIIKEYITRMNGKVWLESEEGKGSTFSFSLPKA